MKMTDKQRNLLIAAYIGIVLGIVALCFINESQDKQIKELQERVEILENQNGE